MATIVLQRWPNKFSKDLRGFATSCFVENTFLCLAQELNNRIWYICLMPWKKTSKVLATTHQPCLACEFVIFVLFRFVWNFIRFWRFINCIHCQFTWYIPDRQEHKVEGYVHAEKVMKHQVDGDLNGVASSKSRKNMWNSCFAIERWYAQLWRHLLLINTSAFHRGPIYTVTNSTILPYRYIAVLSIWIQ